MKKSMVIAMAFVFALSIAYYTGNYAEAAENGKKEVKQEQTKDQDKTKEQDQTRDKNRLREKSKDSNDASKESKNQNQHRYKKGESTGGTIGK